MKIRDEISLLHSKDQAKKLYEKITEEKCSVEKFAEWAGYTREGWYAVADPLSDKVRYALIGRFVLLTEA